MILIGCAFVSWVAVAVAAAAGGGGCPSAVLSAVVPLRSGADCATLNLRGLQQLATLRQAVADANADLKAQDGLSIGLQWEDSCGSDAGAVSAALRLLVDAQQTTCPQPPFHIGMVGPEGESQLTRVMAVTGVFNVTHVLPRATHHAVVTVTVDRTAEQAQSVVAAVRRLGWRGFGLAFEESLSDLADAVVKLANEDAAVCVKGPVERISPPTATTTLPTGSDGTVVLAESAEMASRVLASSASPLLLVVRQVGLEAWQLPTRQNVFLLQQISTINPSVREAMNATLKSQLAAQRQARCNAANAANADCQQDILSEVTDESVTALSDGVRLLAAAFRATRHACNDHANCGRVSAADWRNTLRRVTATRRAPDPTRLRFNMDLPSSYALYARDAAAAAPVQVASVSAGVLYRQGLASYAFPPASLDVGQCEGSPAPLPPSLPVDSAPPPPPLTPTLKDLYTTEYAFYELVGMICGVGFIMFAIMVVIIYVIYNSLVEKGDKESTGGSVESRGGSVAAARGRPQRRNLRDTFRSEPEDVRMDETIVVLDKKVLLDSRKFDAQLQPLLELLPLSTAET